MNEGYIACVRCSIYLSLSLSRPRNTARAQQVATGRKRVYSERRKLAGDDDPMSHRVTPGMHAAIGCRSLLFSLFFFLSPVRSLFLCVIYIHYFLPRAEFGRWDLYRIYAKGIIIAARDRYVYIIHM